MEPTAHEELDGPSTARHPEDDAVLADAVLADAVLADAVLADAVLADAVLADAVSRALLVVLDTLDPAERVAFVLHDMFAVPFDQIAPIVDRSTVATKKLASRARHKVRGQPVIPPSELARQRQVVLDQD